MYMYMYIEKPTIYRSWEHAQLVSMAYTRTCVHVHVHCTCTCMYRLYMHMY